MSILPAMKGHTTTWGQKSSFWSYGIGMIFYYQIVGGYLNTYLLMRGIPLTTIALVFLLIKIWDAINDPLFAYLFDRIQFKGKRKEKCMPWLRIAAILMPIASIAAFNMPGEISQAGKVAWFALTYILWDAAYTICDVPFFSMTTTMTVDMDERNFLFSWARVFHGAGTLFCTTIMTLLVGEMVNMSFGMAAVITCAVGALFTIPLWFAGRERFAVDKVQEEQPAEKFTLAQMLSYLKQNKYLTMMYACQILMACFGVGGAAGMVGTYYIYGATSFGVITTWLSMIPGPVLGLVMPFLLKKFDRFKMYMLCNIFTWVWGLFSFTAYFFGWQTIPFAIASACVTAIPSTLSGLLAFTFTLDALEYGRYKTGINATGINFAVQTFSAKIPGAVNTALGALLLSMTSFVVYEAESIAELATLPQTQQAITEMWVVLGLPPIIVNAVCYGMLLLFYKLRSKDVALMSKYNAGEISREDCDAQLSRRY